LDRIWSPWRYKYINANSGASADKADGCVFCDMQKIDGSDEEKRIVYRGTHNFIVLNIFPYTSGHTLIVPYQHIADFDALQGESMSEYVELSQRVQ
jgi:ATP adenylyltransferase